MQRKSVPHKAGGTISEEEGERKAPRLHGPQKKDSETSDRTERENREHQKRAFFTTATRRWAGGALTRTRRCTAQTHREHQWKLRRGRQEERREKKNAPDTGNAGTGVCHHQTSPELWSGSLCIQRDASCWASAVCDEEMCSQEMRRRSDARRNTQEWRSALQRRAVSPTLVTVRCQFSCGAEQDEDTVLRR